MGLLKSTLYGLSLSLLVCCATPPEVVQGQSKVVESLITIQQNVMESIDEYNFRLLTVVLYQLDFEYETKVLNLSKDITLTFEQRTELANKMYETHKSNVQTATIRIERIREDLLTPMVSNIEQTTRLAQSVRDYLK